MGEIRKTIITAVLLIIFGVLWHFDVFDNKIALGFVGVIYAIIGYFLWLR